MRQKVYLALGLMILCLGVFIWWDIRSSREAIRQSIRPRATLSLNKKSNRPIRRELSQEELAKEKSEKKKPTSTPGAWKDLQKRFPNMIVEKKEEVHFSDGSVETWSLFRTSPENEKLWIVQEANGSFEASVAGEVLLQIKSGEELRQFEQAARDAGFEFELEDSDLGIYAVRFEPEDMGLYRDAMGRFKDMSSSGSQVLPNRMIGIWAAPPPLKNSP